MAAGTVWKGPPFKSKAGPSNPGDRVCPPTGALRTDQGRSATGGAVAEKGCPTSQPPSLSPSHLTPHSPVSPAFRDPHSVRPPGLQPGARANLLPAPALPPTRWEGESSVLLEGR